MTDQQPVRPASAALFLKNSANPPAVPAGVRVRPPKRTPQTLAAAHLSELLAARPDGGGAWLGGCLPAGCPGLPAGAYDALTAGCDVVEIALPTRYAYLDGPALRGAYEAAIDRGWRMADSIALIRDMAAAPPVLAMAYWHTVAAHGPERAARQLAEAGAAGIVLPDLPAAAAPRWMRAAQVHGLHTVLVADPPATPADAEALAACTGAVYMPAVPGALTGSGAGLDPRLSENTGRMRESTGLPVICGIGIDTASRAAHVAEAADVVMVGTALLRACLSDSTTNTLTRVCAELRDAVRTASACTDG